MIKKLRQKFILIATLAVTLVMLLLCLIVNVANFISVDSGLRQMLTVISDNRGSIPPMPKDDRPQEKREGQFTPETPFSTRYFVLRYTDDGSLTGADLDKIAAVTEEDTDTFLSEAISHGEGFGYFSGYRYYVRRVGENRWMAVFLDCYKDMATVGKTALLSLIAMAVCVGLVYVIVVLCSRRAIDPVIQSHQRQKQFITDAGHELKTPITVIATSLKVLEMETGKQKWIDKAQAQTEKLKELVNSLVSLSKMDEEDSPLHFSPFNISDAVSETVDSFSDFARSENHRIEAEIEPGLKYTGDEYAVRQLVSVLIDNAVKYSASETIRFSLKKHKKGIIIQTENGCENLRPQDTAKLFDRFYRADTARTPGTGGFGIGLSLARSIVTAHNGDIRAELHDGKTLTITAKLK